MSDPVYLGDSVYADFAVGMIVLTTNNGHGPTNTIYLEPAVLQNLFDYNQKLHSQPAEDGSPESTDGINDD